MRSKRALTSGQTHCAFKGCPNDIHAEAKFKPRYFIEAIIPFSIESYNNLLIRFQIEMAGLVHAPGLVVTMRIQLSAVHV